MQGGEREASRVDKGKYVQGKNKLATAFGKVFLFEEITAKNSTSDERNL